MCNIPEGFKWSFSKLQSWAQCPMSFKLQYLDRLPDEDNAFSQYGTFCHKLLEQYAKGELPDFLLADAYQEGYDEAVTAPWPPWPKGMPQKYFDQGLAYFESFEGFGDSYDILSAEKRFEIDIGGYPFVGVADLVLRDKSSGDITVVDHKSKSSSTMSKDLSEYRRQLYVYAMYVKQEYGVYPRYLKFNLFRENDWVTEEFTEEACAETVEWIKSTIETIKRDSEWVVCPSSYFCRFICGVLDACPAKEAVLYPPKKGVSTE